MIDKEKANQLKNWVYDHFVMVFTAPQTEPGEDYKWIIPAPAPGEDLEKYCVKLEHAVAQGKETMSAGNRTELKQKAGILVDMIAEFLIQPLVEKYEASEKEWAKIKEKVDGLKSEKDNPIVLPTNAEIRKLGN